MSQEKEEEAAKNTEQPS